LIKENNVQMIMVIYVKYDINLLRSLNKEYKSKPVVDTFPIYDQEHQFKVAENRLVSLSKLVDINGKRVLEIGCGGGYVSRKLATDYGCSVVGIDIYKNHLWEELGEEKNLEYLVVDLSKENPFEYQSFDLIISYTVWEHILHPFTILKECSKLIKPDGAIFIKANLYRSALASHVYRDIYFPYPHLLFPDEVVKEYLIEIGKSSWADRYFEVNKLTYAQYKEYFKILNLKIEYEYLDKKELDWEFYERFEEKLGRYPIYDLELDFFTVLLKLDDSNKSVEKQKIQQESDYATKIKKYEDKINELNTQLNYLKEVNNCLMKKQKEYQHKSPKDKKIIRKELESLANTKPYRVAYFMRRFSHEFLKGDKKDRKDFLRWICCKILRKESGLESKYNYLMELAKKI